MELGVEVTHICRISTQNPDKIQIFRVHFYAVVHLTGAISTFNEHFEES